MLNDIIADNKIKTARGKNIGLNVAENFGIRVSVIT